MEEVCGSQTGSGGVGVGGLGVFRLKNVTIAGDTLHVISRLTLTSPPTQAAVAASRRRFPLITGMSRVETLK